MTGQAYSFFSDFFRDAANLEDDTTGFDDGYPVIDSTLTTTHAGLGRLGGDRFVWKDTDPHFATALHEACEGDTCGLYLTSLHPAWLKGLQAVLAEGKGVTTLGHTFHATAMLSAILCT